MISHWRRVAAPIIAKVLAETEEIVATSDSVILDRCGRWVNLAGTLIAQHVPHARVVDLSSSCAG